MLHVLILRWKEEQDAKALLLKLDIGEISMLSG